MNDTVNKRQQMEWTVTSTDKQHWCKKKNEQYF